MKIKIFTALFALLLALRVEYCVANSIPQSGLSFVPNGIVTPVYTHDDFFDGVPDYATFCKKITTKDMTGSRISYDLLMQTVEQNFRWMFLQGETAAQFLCNLDEGPANFVLSDKHHVGMVTLDGKKVEFGKTRTLRSGEKAYGRFAEMADGSLSEFVPVILSNCWNLVLTDGWTTDYQENEILGKERIVYVHDTVYLTQQLPCLEDGDDCDCEYQDEKIYSYDPSCMCYETQPQYQQPYYQQQYPVYYAGVSWSASFGFGYNYYQPSYPVYETFVNYETYTDYETYTEYVTVYDSTHITIIDSTHITVIDSVIVDVPGDTLDVPTTDGSDTLDVPTDDGGIVIADDGGILDVPTDDGGRLAADELANMQALLGATTKSDLLALESNTAQEGQPGNIGNGVKKTDKGVNAPVEVGGKPAINPTSIKKEVTAEVAVNAVATPEGSIKVVKQYSQPETDNLSGEPIEAETGSVKGNIVKNNATNPKPVSGEATGGKPGSVGNYQPDQSATTDVAVTDTRVNTGQLLSEEKSYFSDTRVNTQVSTGQQQQQVFVDPRVKSNTQTNTGSNTNTGVTDTRVQQKNTYQGNATTAQTGYVDSRTKGQQQKPNVGANNAQTNGSRPQMNTQSGKKSETGRPSYNTSNNGASNGSRNGSYKPQLQKQSGSSVQRPAPKQMVPAQKKQGRG